MSYKRLTRSRERKVCGVCGGVAEYFELDPTLVRLGFVLLLFLSAVLPCLLAYFVAAAIIPEKI
ncbi:MAG: PspC domain-containing protein [Alloprevotella sp.]